MAQQLSNDLKRLGATGQLVDLRQHPLPLCGTDTAYDDPMVAKIRQIVEAASAIILTVPIYNYDINAAAKNMIELTGRRWENKVVGFACAAGGRSSYMSVMGIANSLMLDFRCLITPRFVYATGDDFGNDRTLEMYIQSETIQERLTELAGTAFALTESWNDIQQR
jgi:FMN reductase